MFALLDPEEHSTRGRAPRDHPRCGGRLRHGGVRCAVCATSFSRLVCLAQREEVFMVGTFTSPKVPLADVVAVPRFPLGSKTLERVHSGTCATLVSGTTWQRIHRERALYLRSRRLRHTLLASWKRPRGTSPSHVSLLLWCLAIYPMHLLEVRRRIRPRILNRVASSPLRWRCTYRDR